MNYRILSISGRKSRNANDGYGGMNDLRTPLAKPNNCIALYIRKIPTVLVEIPETVGIANRPSNLMTKTSTPWLGSSGINKLYFVQRFMLNVIYSRFF